MPRSTRSPLSGMLSHDTTAIGRAVRAATGVERDDEAHERRARPGAVQAAGGREAAPQDAEVGGDGGVVEVGGAVVP